MNKILLGFIIFIIFFSCKKDKAQEPELKLLFSSGFENGVVLDSFANGYQNISGTDSETGFSWPIAIWGASEETGLHLVHHDNQQALHNEIQTVIGHDGLPTKALYNYESYDVEYTQCPYEILDVVNGRQDLYVKYWMKLDSASLTQEDKWRAIFEYKTKGYALGLGYRLIAYVYTNENGEPYWHFQGDRNPEHPIWEIDNYDIPVPVNEWFMVEYYWKWSNSKKGKSVWKVNGETVGKHKGATTRFNKAIDFIMLTQIYGNANPKFQWIDDIEIWNRNPN